MSIEAAIAELTKSVAANTEAVLEQNRKLDVMLNKAGASTTASTTAATEDEKPARKPRAKKGEEDAKADEAFTTESVKKLAGEWLGEFKANENDPETEARRAKIKAALAKVADKEGATIADVPVAELGRVVNWLDKQKALDAGFGVGRLTAVPSDDDDGDTSAGDDDI